MNVKKLKNFDLNKLPEDLVVLSDLSGSFSHTQVYKHSKDADSAGKEKFEIILNSNKHSRDGQVSITNSSSSLKESTVDTRIIECTRKEGSQVENSVDQQMKSMKCNASLPESQELASVIDLNQVECQETSMRPTCDKQNVVNVVHDSLLEELDQVECYEPIMKPSSPGNQNVDVVHDSLLENLDQVECYETSMKPSSPDNQNVVDVIHDSSLTAEVSNLNAGVHKNVGHQVWSRMEDGNDEIVVRSSRDNEQNVSEFQGAQSTHQLKPRLPYLFEMFTVPKSHAMQNGYKTHSDGTSSKPSIRAEDAIFSTREKDYVLHKLVYTNPATDSPIKPAWIASPYTKLLDDSADDKRKDLLMIESTNFDQNANQIQGPLASNSTSITDNSPELSPSSELLMQQVPRTTDALRNKRLKIGDGLSTGEVHQLAMVVKLKTSDSTSEKEADI